MEAILIILAFVSLPESEKSAPMLKEVHKMFHTGIKEVYEQLDDLSHWYILYFCQFMGPDMQYETDGQLQCRELNRK